MNSIFIVSLLALVSAVPVDDALKCRDYRTGTFRMVDKELNRQFLIERTETMQVETDLTDKSFSRFKVNWISDCEYELTVATASPEVTKFYEGKILSVRIIDTSRKSYTFEAELKGANGMKVVQTLERVK